MAAMAGASAGCSLSSSFKVWVWHRHYKLLDRSRPKSPCLICFCSPFNCITERLWAGGKERNAYNVQEHCAKSEDAPASFTPPPLRVSADSQYAMHAGKAQHRATSVCSASARRAAFGSAYHMAFSAKAGHSHYGYDHPVPTTEFRDQIQRCHYCSANHLKRSFLK